jgi:hypothetical protein
MWHTHVPVQSLRHHHVSMRIMYKGNDVSYGDHQNPILLVSNDNRHNNSFCGSTAIYSCGLYDHDVVVVLGCEEAVVMDVHILHSRPQKIPVTTNVSQKLPSAIFDDLNIDWLSVQKDIVIQILWKIDFYDTDFTGWTFSGRAVSRYMGVPTYIR